MPGTGTAKVTWELTTVPAGAVLSDVSFNSTEVTGDIKNGAEVTAEGLESVQVIKLSEKIAKLDGKLTWYEKGKNGKLKEKDHKFLRDYNAKTSLTELKCETPPVTPAPVVSFKSNCDSVEVTIENKSNATEQFEVTGVEGPTPVPAGQSKVIKVVGSKITAGKVEVRLIKGEAKELVGSFEWKATPCETATPSAPGSGVASASSTAPALPVTGANTAIMVGSAVVLVGAGAGLFMVARRRRVRFAA